MPKSFPPIGSLMLGTALLLLGNGLLSTLIALRGTHEGFSDQLLGLMGSAYFVGFLLGTRTVPLMIRRIGHIRAFAFFAAVIAAATLLHSLVVNVPMWLFLRLITGIALVGFYTVIESWLNSRSKPEQRSQIFAIYMVVNMSALAVAQQLLLLAPAESFTLFSLSAMLVCLSILPLTSTRQPQPEVPSVKRLTLPRMWRVAPAATVAAVASGLSIGTFWSMGPLYASRLGLDSSGIATLMTATILGGAALQLPLGRLSDRLDRRQVLALAAAGAAIGAVAMAFAGDHAGWLPATSFVFGGMAFALYPITVAHVVDRLAHEEILSGNAAVLLLHGLGAVVGPTLAGVLMAFGGALALPLYFAVILTALALFVVLETRRHRVDIVIEDSASFVPMMRTAETAMGIAAAVEEHRLETEGHIEPTEPVESDTEPFLDGSDEFDEIDAFDEFDEFNDPEEADASRGPETGT